MNNSFSFSHLVLCAALSVLSAPAYGEAKPSKKSPSSNEIQCNDIRAVIIDKDKAGTNVRTAPGGEEILAKIEHRYSSVSEAAEEEANWADVNIIAADGNGWFKVEVTYNGKNLLPEGQSAGWMHSSVANTNFADILFSQGVESNVAYLQPSEDGESVPFLELETSDSKFFSCSGDFVAFKAKRRDGDEEHKVFYIKKEKTCSNPFTTCS